jgi:hypothetical protein
MKLLRDGHCNGVNVSLLEIKPGAILIQWAAVSNCSPWIDVCDGFFVFSSAMHPLKLWTMSIFYYNNS